MISKSTAAGAHTHKAIKWDNILDFILSPILEVITRLTLS